MRSFSAIMLSASHRSPAIAPIRSPETPVILAAMAENASSQLAGCSLPSRRTQGLSSRRRRVAAHPLTLGSLVAPRQDAQHFGAAAVDADIGADRIQHVDAVCLGQLPRP